MRGRLSVVMVLTAALAAGGVPAIAAAAPGAAVVAERGDAREVSLDEAVALVARRTGGKVLSADTVTSGGERVHRIRVLVREGHVRVYEVDPETGAME